MLRLKTDRRLVAHMRWVAVALLMVLAGLAAAGCGRLTTATAAPSSAQIYVYDLTLASTTPSMNLSPTAVGDEGRSPGSSGWSVPGFRCCVAAEEAGTAAPDLANLSSKIEGDLVKRGWTPQEIQDAYDNGEQIPAVNKANGAAATRYVNPTTGRSVVIENDTGQVIHVGGQGFKYGPGSGDLP